MKINIEPEDFQRITKITKIIIPLIILIIIILLICKGTLEKINTDKFYNCMKNLDIPLDKNNRKNGILTYNTTIDKYLLEKSIDSTELGANKNIILYYNIDTNSIDSGLTLRNDKGLYAINGIYNINNKKFQCQIIQNDGFNSKCKELQEKSKDFTQEINKIIQKCNVKTKYIKFKNKK